MAEELVLCTKEDGIAKVTINNPDTLNSLDPAMLKALEETFKALEGDKSLKCVILTGAGPKSFVAGADIPTMVNIKGKEIDDYIGLGQRVMRAVETFPTPVIAMMNGFALGGGLELALSCDLIVASERAKIGQPEVNLGIIPGFGGTQRLIQRCGIAVSRRLTYTGDIIRAPEALQLGIVDYVAEPDDLEKQTYKVAKNICSKGPLAVKAAKEAIRRSEEEWLLRGLDLEVECFVNIFDSADRKEGMQAFMEKRKPVFKGE